MAQDSPGTVELTCPGCEAYFRLKPKKGRLPQGPIPCPKCSTPIAMPKPPQAPAAAVLGPNSTFVGLSAPPRGFDQVDPERTDVVDRADFEQTLREAERGAQEAEGWEALDPTLDTGPAESGPFDLRQIVEAERIALGDVNSNDVTHIPSSEGPGAPNPYVPGPHPNESGALFGGERESTRPDIQMTRELADSSAAEEERPAGAAPAPPRRPPPVPISLDALRRARRPDRAPSDPRQDAHSGLFPIGASLGAEPSAPGAASERRGSGYVRLPTTEIIEALGEGSYRLMVEEIVYEPVDEHGLATLIKSGVLMGAEQIADLDGEWRPINDHPVIKRLRRKMAAEAHALLSPYRGAQSPPPTAPETLPPPSAKTLPLAALSESETWGVGDSIDESAETAERRLISFDLLDHEEAQQPGDPPEVEAEAAARPRRSEAVDEGLDEIARPRRTRLLAIAVLILIAGASLAVLAVALLDRDDLDEPAPPVAARAQTPELAPAAPVAAAPEPVSFADRVRAALEAGSWSEAAEAWEQSWGEGGPDREATEAYFAGLERAERWSALRQASARAGAPWVSARRKAAAADVRLRGWNLEALDPAALGDSVRLEERARGPALVFARGDRETWVFEPIGPKRGREEAAREVVAWRLCELLGCSFKVPQARPARLSRAAAEAAGLKTSALDAIVWSEQGSERVAEGIVREVVPAGAAFPIGATNTWRPWLDGSVDASVLAEPWLKALGSWGERNPEWAARLQAEGARTDEVAAQLSEFLTVDALLNNMNRFRDRPSGLGFEDNRFARGRLTSAEHATTLSTRFSGRVRARFGWVDRYTRGLIESLRALDESAASEALFAAGSGLEARERDAFWKRRRYVLDAVEKAEASAGTPSTLFFP